MAIPTTLKEAVDIVISWSKTAEQEEIDLFLRTPRKDLIIFHDTLGRNIRNELKLWGNEGAKLREDCCNGAIKDRGVHGRLEQLGVASDLEHADLASMIIIEAVWDKLRLNKSC